MGSSVGSGLEARAKTAREALDAWVREVVAWHFDPATGTPFWLDFAKRAGWDPRREVKGYADLERFGYFQDEWLRGGPVRRWVPLGYKDRPVYVFETGGSTGRAEVPHQHRGLPDRLRALQRHAARRALPEGRRLAPGGAHRARGACGWRSSTSASSAAASASWSTSTRAGSSS